MVVGGVTVIIGVNGAQLLHRFVLATLVVLLLQIDRDGRKVAKSAWFAGATEKRGFL